MAKKPKQDTNPKPRGKCDACRWCRFVAEDKSNNKYMGGLCEIGLKIRGVATLPAEQTCSAWEQRA